MRMPANFDRIGIDENVELQYNRNMSNYKEVNIPQQHWIILRFN